MPKKFELDVKEFWRENEKCFIPFTTDKPRVPLSFWLDDHFLFEELNLTKTLKYYQDTDFRLKMHQEINQRTEKIIGKKYYIEEKGMNLNPRRFEVIMGAHWEYTEGGTPWLESKIKSIDDLKQLINQNMKLDMKKEVFPEGWFTEKELYEQKTNKIVKLGGDGSRGPATMATSILGTVNTCMFIMDYPEIMDEFFAVLAEKLIEYHKILMKATDKPKTNGYSLADDNCYLFPPEQYQRFCAPFLTKIFTEFAPKPDDKRHQHSDSSMAHLMPILDELGVNTVNLGPDIEPLDIRKAMPDAVIEGQIPPLTLRNGTPSDIITAVRRDIDTVGQDGGLVECPAGSVAAGTPLKNLKIYMWAVDTYGRY